MQPRWRLDEIRDDADEEESAGATGQQVTTGVWGVDCKQSSGVVGRWGLCDEWSVQEVRVDQKGCTTGRQ
jgi:hypothetical protein